MVDKDQVNKITSAAFCFLRLIKKIEKCLPLELLKTVIMALILRRIDYCNSLYLTLAIGLVKRLQILQNTAACFLFKIPKYEAAEEQLGNYTSCQSSNDVVSKLSVWPINLCMDSGQTILKRNSNGTSHLGHFDQALLGT